VVVLNFTTRLKTTLRESAPERIALITIVAGLYFLVTSAGLFILGTITLGEMLTYVWVLSGVLILSGTYAGRTTLSRLVGHGLAPVTGFATRRSYKVGYRVEDMLTSFLIVLSFVAGFFIILAFPPLPALSLGRILLSIQIALALFMMLLRLRTSTM
jgi:hypothetical protein